MGKNIFIIWVYLFWNMKKNYFWKKIFVCFKDLIFLLETKSFKISRELKRTSEGSLLKILCKALIKSKEKLHKRLVGWLWKDFKRYSKEDLVLASFKLSLDIFPLFCDWDLFSGSYYFFSQNWDELCQKKKFIEKENYNKISKIFCFIFKLNLKIFFQQIFSAPNKLTKIRTSCFKQSTNDNDESFLRWKKNVHFPFNDSSGWQNTLYKDKINSIFTLGVFEYY